MTLNWKKWRELWAALPESGWPVSEAIRFLKNPPRLFVACSSIFGLFVVGRAVYLIGFGSADEVNKFIVGVAAFAGAPFLIWRTWIADRQRHIAQEELYTSLLTKAVEQLGATREEKRYEIPEFQADLFGMERHSGHLVKKRDFDSNSLKHRGSARGHLCPRKARTGLFVSALADHGDFMRLCSRERWKAQAMFERGGSDICEARILLCVRTREKDY